MQTVSKPSRPPCGARPPIRPHTGIGRATCLPEGSASDAEDAVCLRDCGLAREIASAFFAIPVRDIERPTRAAALVCEARHVAIYLAHVVFQLTLNRTAVGFGRDRTSVAHAVRRIEDRRDDGEFDAKMERLEALAHAIRAATGGVASGKEIR